MKDWKLSTIQRIDPFTVTLSTEVGEKEKPNPLEQARFYAFAIKELLEHDKLLIQALESTFNTPVRHTLISTASIAA